MLYVTCDILRVRSKMGGPQSEQSSKRKHQFSFLWTVQVHLPEVPGRNFHCRLDTVQHF